MAARKKKKTQSADDFAASLAPGGKERAAERRAVYEELWQRPGYVKLHALKDRLGPAWNRADAFQHQHGGSPAKASALGKRFDRVVKKINRVESAALMKKLGVSW